jgi:hypothetical protein
MPLNWPLRLSIAMLVLIVPRRATVRLLRTR